MRVVLDTNVIVSSMLRRGSAADLLRRAWEDDRFTLITSNWQLDELRRVSRYPRLQKHLKPHEFGRLMGQIRRRAIVLEALSPVEVSRDPDDDPILATAVTGEAEWLITGDKGDLLALRKVERTRIVTAREFLSTLT